MNDIKKHNFSLKKKLIRLTRGVWVKTVWPKIQIGRGCWPAMKSRQYCWNPGTRIRRRWMPGDKLTSAGLAYIRPRRDQPLSRCQVINQRNRQHCWRCFCRPLWTKCFVLFYCGSVCFIGMLEWDLRVLRRPRVTWNLAFIPGSSKHGNAFLASVGENCVVAKYLYSKKAIKNDMLYPCA